MRRPPAAPAAAEHPPGQAGASRHGIRAGAGLGRQRTTREGARWRTASDLAGRPLRKDRPLRELHLLDGYGDGGALLLRTHHAIADGAALMQVLLALADPLDAGEHTGVLPVHDDTAGPPPLPGPAGRTAGRAIAAARRAGAAAGDLSAVLRAALADPRKAAGLAGAARADAAMLRKLGFGLTTGRNRLQGPLVPGKQRAWTRPACCWACSMMTRPGRSRCTAFSW